MKTIIFLILLTLSSSSFAAVEWTDGNYQGPGIGVTDVYPQWANHWITFKGSDGKRYFYYWGESEMPNEKAQILQSMLLTALAADFKVSVAAETVAVSGMYEFTFLNLKK